MFASDTLKPGGHFVCKFYQGAEDKQFENLLKKMFARVHREKPDSSRSVRLLPFTSCSLCPVSFITGQNLTTVVPDAGIERSILRRA